MSNHNSYKTKVPVWETFFPKIDEIPKEQYEFYSYFKKNIVSGNIVEVEGNTSYIYLYAKELIDELTEDVIRRKLACVSMNTINLDKFIAELTKLRLFYCQTNQDDIKIKNLKHSITLWMSDAYILIGDYNNAWQILRETRISINQVINILGKCKETYLYGNDIIQILRSESGITKIGINYKENIDALATQYLTAFHSVNNLNVIEYIISQFNNWNPMSFS